MFKAVKLALLKVFPGCFDDDSEEIWEEREFGFSIGLVLMSIWFWICVIIGLIIGRRS